MVPDDPCGTTGAGRPDGITERAGRVVESAGTNRLRILAPPDAGGRGPERTCRVARVAGLEPGAAGLAEVTGAAGFAEVAEAGLAGFPPASV